MQYLSPNVLVVAKSVQTHQRTAVEVAEEALSKAETHQDEWRAFITLTPELARKHAEQVDQWLAEDKRLPLAGVPFAIKDLFDVQGVATTCGSKVFADRVATADATVVRRLVAAGAVMLGKLNLHECAFGFTGENPHYFFPAVDYLKAQRARRRIRAAWSKVFSQVDCLVTPTSPLVATRFGQQSADLPGGPKPLVRAYLDLTLPFNLSGHPAISVPCGISSDGMPIGAQVVGKPFAEGTILRVAHRYQQVTDWHRRTRETA